MCPTLLIPIFRDIIDFVIPELQRRGLSRIEMEKRGATAREVYAGCLKIIVVANCGGLHADEGIPSYVRDVAI